MIERVILDELAEAGVLAARGERWYAEYFQTAVSPPPSAWSSPDADVIGDMRRFIEAERRRVFTLAPDPVPVHPDVYDAIQTLAGSPQRGVRGMLDEREAQVCAGALETVLHGRR